MGQTVTSDCALCPSFEASVSAKSARVPGRECSEQVRGMIEAREFAAMTAAAIPFVPAGQKSRRIFRLGRSNRGDLESCYAALRVYFPSLSLNSTVSYGLRTGLKRGGGVDCSVGSPGVLLMHLCQLIVISIFLVSSSSVRLMADEPAFERIFDGQSLRGWSGEAELWSVQDGAITGVTTDDAPLEYNKFLIWDGEVENFHLRAKVRLVGKSNSGIQYRSVHLKDAGEYVVGGYQCDIHPQPENNGMLYHERGRGIVAKHGQKVIVDEAGDKWVTGTTGPVQKIQLDEWNTYEIIATGNRLIHKLNGSTCAEIIDHHEAGRLLKGLIAFQVHRGPAMQVQAKDIELKRLPAGGVLSLAEAPIPDDAQKVPGRTARPRKKRAQSESK